MVRSIRAVGKVEFDETRLHHVHTKIGGWIERLEANATGELVRKGQPLLTIYSPELLASQQEYLLAVEARKRLAGATVTSVAGSGEELVASARRRLLLYDMTDDQIVFAPAFAPSPPAPAPTGSAAPASFAASSLSICSSSRPCSRAMWCLEIQPVTMLVLSG